MSTESQGGFNLSVLGSELKNQHQHQLAADVMSKCHKNCIMSVDEDRLLPTEEACFRNCFVKSA